MPNEDMSESAIMSRYRRANEMAIATSNRIVFISLMDLFTLIGERKVLKQRIAELEAQVKDAPIQGT